MKIYQRKLSSWLEDLQGSLTVSESVIRESFVNEDEGEECKQHQRRERELG